MRPYEVMVILDAGLEDDVVRTTVDRATQLLESRGASIGRVDRWGKRRFAYELKHRWEGFYVLMRVEGDPPVMAELDRQLFLADEVLRHKVIRLPETIAGREPVTLGAAAAAAIPEASQDANGE